MLSFILLLIIGQSMANPIKLPEEFVDNERIERVESAIYELLNIIHFSDNLDVKEQLLSKLQKRILKKLSSLQDTMLYYPRFRMHCY